MRMPREFYIPKGSTKVADKQSDAVVYVYEAHNKAADKMVPYAVAFHGKAAKPDWHYRFRNIADRDKRIADHFESTRAHAKLVAERRAEDKNAGTGLVVGDILRCSWGYDQTNVDYYQVTQIIGKRMVEIRPIGAESRETGYMSGRCVPVKDKFIGEPMRKAARNGTVRIASYASAYKIEPIIKGDASTYEGAYWSSYA